MILREHNRNVAFTICFYEDTIACGYINGVCEMVNVEALLGYVKDITCSSTKVHLAQYIIVIISYGSFDSVRTGKFEI